MKRLFLGIGFGALIGLSNVAMAKSNFAESSVLEGNAYMQLASDDETETSTNVDANEAATNDTDGNEDANRNTQDDDHGITNQDSWQNQQYDEDIETDQQTNDTDWQYE